MVLPQMMSLLRSPRVVALRFRSYFFGWWWIGWFICWDGGYITIIGIMICRRRRCRCHLRFPLNHLLMSEYEIMDMHSCTVVRHTYLVWIPSFQCCRAHLHKRASPPFLLNPLHACDSHFDTCVILTYLSLKLLPSSSFALSYTSLDCFASASESNLTCTPSGQQYLQA